ncbi:uncharacterized protein V6R79_004122 [Siganus canaliculatus]
MEGLQPKELDSLKPEPEPSLGSMKKDLSAEDAVTDGQMATSVRVNMLFRSQKESKTITFNFSIKRLMW